MAAVPLFRDTNMAAVTSRENTVPLFSSILDFHGPSVDPQSWSLWIAINESTSNIFIGMPTKKAKKPRHTHGTEKPESWRILPLNAVTTLISRAAFHSGVFERSLKLKPTKKIAHVAFYLYTIRIVFIKWRKTDRGPLKIKWNEYWQNKHTCAIIYSHFWWLRLIFGAFLFWEILVTWLWREICCYLTDIKGAKYS